MNIWRSFLLLITLAICGSPVLGQDYSTRKSQIDDERAAPQLDSRSIRGIGLVDNGSFETNTGVGAGFVSGWTTNSISVGSAGEWQVQSGLQSPLNGFSVPAPTNGSFAMMTDQFGPGSHVLFQEITVPAVGGTLLLDLLVNNSAVDFFTPNTLDPNSTPNQQFRIDVMSPGSGAFALGGSVLRNLFRTNTGEVFPLAYQTLAFDLDEFAGQTIRLRFAEVDTENFFNVGVDNVRITQDSVSLALCLAIDGSGSIDSSDFSLQLEGYAQAITDPAIVPQDGSVSLAAVQFSTNASLEIPLTVIQSAQDANNFANQVRNISQRDDDTAIGDAIDLCQSTIQGQRLRQKIDVSTDGESNEGIDPVSAADAAFAAGIDEINVLGIGTAVSTPNLESIARPQPVSQFPDAGFVLLADNFVDFSRALRAKIAGEIGGPEAVGVPLILRHSGFFAWHIFTISDFNTIVSRRISLPRKPELHVMDVKDVDASGGRDVLLRDSLRGNWTRFILDGSGGVSAVQQLPITRDLAWEFQGSGDFDGDGLSSDVLLRNRVTGRWFIVLLNQNGQRIAGGGVGMTTNLSWELQAISDINENGIDDVILRNSSTGSWHQFRFASAFNIGVSARIPLTRNRNWGFRAIGDLDGDQLKDVILRNSSTGAWFRYEIDKSNSVAVLAEPIAGLTRDLSWTFRGLEDFDFNGSDDILIRQTFSSDLRGRWFLYQFGGSGDVINQGPVGLTFDLSWNRGELSNRDLLRAEQPVRD